ncbi:MAG: O-methyltransferase [Terriglobia bacterium]|nr:O-methyltransferase [Terriglobia bacterium]
MGEIFIDGIDEYIHSLLPARDEVLTEIEEQARQRNIPIVGPAVGRLFYQLVQMTQAESVFEMGSAVGYSTIWWARAVGEGGRVIYTDGDRKNADEARGYFQRAGVADRIDIRTGDALELLSEEKGQFDIIFCDIDKDDYPRALRLASRRVRKGGLFVADNTLWHGRVIAAEGSKEADMETTKAIKEFNQALYESKEFFTTLLPLRDGVAVAMKI